MFAMLGCASAGPTHAELHPLEVPRTLMMIGGPETALTNFEAAAAKCGLTGVIRKPNQQLGNTTIRVVGPASWIMKEGPYSCAMRWLLDHPQEGIGFLGNEAMQVFEEYVSDARPVYTDTIGPNERLTPDCRQWIRTRQKGRNRPSSLEAWVEGVITGYNVYHAKSPEDRPDLLGSVELSKESRTLSDAFKAIDERCSHAPDAALARVTLDLIDEWRRK